jgi:hypothetical protein
MTFIYIKESMVSRPLNPVNLEVLGTSKGDPISKAKKNKMSNS